MRELFVDNFAGGGGASTGIEMAIGRSVDIAINHDPDAISMHRANHPDTKHYCEDVWQVDPEEACGGHPVALAWFSPDCKHFSRAKGGKPVDKNIRGLAWVAVKWAATVRPRCLMLENVPEIMTWGPLIPQRDTRTGRVLVKIGGSTLKTRVAEPGEVVAEEDLVMLPDPERRGETFEAFVGALSTGISKDHPAFKEMCDALEISPFSEMADRISHGLGYKVEFKVIKSCEFGAPTSRTRFYMIARCDGTAIVWPEPTHAPRNSQAVKDGIKQPYRTAAECIDWSIPTQSIFERDKPLAENTLRRIARGIQKFVVENQEPFIVTVNHSGDSFRGQEIHEPLHTVTAKHGYGLVTPTIMCNNANNLGADVESPLPTVTTGNRNYLVAPSIVPVGYGERDGQLPRVNSVEDPLGTVVTSGKHYLITPTLIQYHDEQGKDEVRAQELTEPIMTIDASPRYALSCAHIMKYYAGGYKGAGSAANTPLGTITALPRHYMVTSHIMHLRNNQIGQPMDEPLSTVASSGAHHAEVQAFLLKYYNTGGAKPVNEPLDTVTAKDRFAVITVHGEEYIITDIRMRMLQPRELFSAQGFPEDYIIETDADGKPYPKSKQVARCGNAVTPPVPAALVRANLPEYCGLAA